MVSRFTLPARPRPRWWSVWLPPSSVRPGVEKSQVSESSVQGKVSANSRISSRRRAAAAGAAALAAWLRGEEMDAGALEPVYLRLPQAERELLKRQGK